MSSSLWPHGLQHARPPRPSATPGVHPNPCPLSPQCHPIIPTSVVPFSPCPQFPHPASGSFPMSQLFPSGGQSIGTSASASFLPMNIQDWFCSGLTGLISLQSKGFSRAFSNTIVQKHQFFRALYGPALTSVQDYWKNHSFDYMDLCWQVMSLLFNMLSRFVLAFLPRSKFLNLWLQSPSAAILEPEKGKSVSAFIFFPYYLPWGDGIGCHDLSFLKVEF